MSDGGYDVKNRQGEGGWLMNPAVSVAGTRFMAV